MSLETIQTRMKVLHLTLTGINRVHKDTPNAIDTADLPFLTVRYTGTDMGNTPFQGGRRYDHNFIVTIWGDPVGQAQDEEERLYAIRPFFERMEALYAANIQLDSLSGVTFCELTTARSLVQPMGKLMRASLEFDLTVTEKVTVTVGL